MHRIKVPGSDRNKKILLIILIIIAIGVISYDAFERISSKTNRKSEEQQEIVESIKTDEESNIISKSNQEVSEDNSKLGNDDKSIIEKKNEKNYSDEENQLYNEAYESFFSHDYTNAISKADLMISKFPNNAMGYNIRGITKAYNGDYEGGMKDIDKSLSLNNNYGYARFNKALTYELYGNMDNALNWYNKALEVEDYVWSYYGIASIYGRRGNVTNTMNYLNKAIRMDAGVKDIAKNEHDFDPVKDTEEFQKAVYK
jgi:tetratricopeptide (TPR) repeat protein